MNVLLVDFYSASNRGDAAILEGMREAILDAFPGARIKVLSENPATVRALTGLDAGPVLLSTTRMNAKKYAQMAFLAAAAKLGFLQSVLPRLSGHARSRIEDYLAADAVVSVGGQLYTENYSNDVKGRLFGLWFAKTIGKKVMIYAQSLGAFRKKTYRAWMRHVLDRVDAITVRETISEAVVRALGVRTPVVVTADAALAMDPRLPDAERERFEHKLLSEGVALDGEALRVSVSLREWPYANGRIRSPRDAFARFVDWLVEEERAEVYLLSTCTGFGGYAFDDRLASRALLDGTRRAEKVFLLQNEYSPRELASFYGRMDVHVGMRMHSCLLALLAGTPVLPVQYEHKTLGLMRELGMEELLVELEDLSFEALRKSFLKIKQGLPSYRLRVSRGVRTLREKEKKNRQVLKGLFPDGVFSRPQEASGPPMWASNPLY